MYNYPNWKNGNGHRLKNVERSRIVFGNRIGSLFLYASLLALVAFDILVLTCSASAVLDSDRTMLKLNDSVVNSQTANIVPLVTSQAAQAARLKHLRKLLEKSEAGRQNLEKLIGSMPVHGRRLGGCRRRHGNCRRRQSQTCPGKVNDVWVSVGIGAGGHSHTCPVEGCGYNGGALHCDHGNWGGHSCYACAANGCIKNWWYNSGGWVGGPIKNSGFSTDAGDSLGVCQPCTTCSEGKYRHQDCASNADTICSVCPTGQYQDLIQQTSCKGCPPGQYQDLIQQTGCKGCPIGQYQDQNKQTGCKTCSNNCGPGEYFTACPAESQSHANGCHPCSSGYHQNSGKHQNTACSVCPIGYFSLSYWHKRIRIGNRDCTECSAGYYSSVQASSGCTGCTTGKFSGEKASDCTGCPKGYYQNEQGQASRFYFVPCP